MAMSLEDLLAKEGFKRRKEKLRPRASFASETSVPLYMRKGKHEAGSSMPTKRTERTRSDIPRYDSKSDFSTSSSFTGRKPRDNITLERRGHRDSWDAKRSTIGGSSKDLRGSEITEVVQSNEVYKDIYSNKVYSNNGSIGKDKKKDKNNSSKQSKMTNIEDAPCLNEASIKAVISILSGHAKRFIDDEDFRASLHHNSFASLNVLGLDESKVIENLEQAIEIVERVVEDNTTSKDLKRASLQLSVITGINSNDFPNARLSACAHLYLSVIYVLQKKDGIAAKHLLQVFSNSPFQARTTLLPELWDRVFLPHLSHLKVWYDKEAHFLSESSLELLEKVYNGSVDSGTYQLAEYYKDWIMDGVEAPSLPSIEIPSFSVGLNLTGGLVGRMSSHVSPQPMVSKELYDQVFRHSHKAGVELQVYEEKNSDVSAFRSSNSSAPQDKQLILCSNSPAPQDKQLILCTEHSGEFFNNNITVADEQWKLHISSVAEDKLLPETKQNEDSVNHIALMQEAELGPVQETKENYESPSGKPFLHRIPEDFLCPLTRLLFKDPVTLETGQTFECEAITDWFDKGFVTCPVTRKALHCNVVPPTNLILKRVISEWKTDRIEQLLSLLSDENKQGNANTSICIIGELLPVLSEDERVTSARQVISSGGLQFVMRRFPSANAEEKMFIVRLLLCCIEVDAVCRDDIARNIDQSSLLQMLHNEEGELRTNAVLLLTELVCFNKRSRAKYFVEGLLDEEIINAMDDLMMYLQTCPLEQTPLVAVLILHLDLLSERERSKVYRQEAVDALTVGLRQSLSDKNVENKCCRALLILGGFFSSSGKLMTEDWILKLAGFLNGPDGDIADDDSIEIAPHGTLTKVNSMSSEKEEKEEEESAREKWLVRLSGTLLEDGKRYSFLDAISKCLSLGNSDLVRVCLTTVGWLSFSLASLHDKKLQLHTFLALIPPLKQRLEHGEFVEQKVLASLSLLNFTTIPECRILVMKIGEEVGHCLDNLAEITWTAKELRSIISGDTPT